MAEEKRGVFGILKDSGKHFMSDECPRQAAALAYYTIFSLPPLLVLLMMIAGALWEPQQVREALTGQFSSLMGEQGTQQIVTMMQEAERPAGQGIVPTLLGIAALLFGATGAFFQLQSALNRTWEVQPDPAQSGIRNFITKRLLSLGMILVIAFLVLVSLALSAALSAFGNALGDQVPGLTGTVMMVINFAVSLAIITALFAAMFKVLPDADVAWKDVWIGALATALLFVIGKFAIGYYIGRSEPGSAYGAAGALVVVLLWVYFSAMIVLFGAEFTEEWANERGEGVRPEEGAVRVEEQKVITRTKEQHRNVKEEKREKGERPPPKKEWLRK